MVDKTTYTNRNASRHVAWTVTDMYRRLLANGIGVRDWQMQRHHCEINSSKQFRQISHKFEKKWLIEIFAQTTRRPCTAWCTTLKCQQKDHNVAMNKTVTILVVVWVLVLFILRTVQVAWIKRLLNYFRWCHYLGLQLKNWLVTWLERGSWPANFPCRMLDL